MTLNYEYTCCQEPVIISSHLCMKTKTCTKTKHVTPSINITIAFYLRHPSFRWTHTAIPFLKCWNPAVILLLLCRGYDVQLRIVNVLLYHYVAREKQSFDLVCIWVARIIIISLYVSLVYLQQMCGNWFCITPNHLLFIHSSFVLFSMNWTRSEWMFGIFYHLPVVQTNEGYESFLLSFIFWGITAFNHMLL